MSPSSDEVKSLLALEIAKYEEVHVTAQHKLDEDAKELAMQLELARKERKALFEEQQKAAREREVMKKKLAEQQAWLDQEFSPAKGNPALPACTRGVFVVPGGRAQFGSASPHHPLCNDPHIIS